MTLFSLCNMVSTPKDTNGALKQLWTQNRLILGEVMWPETRKNYTRISKMEVYGILTCTVVWLGESEQLAVYFCRILVWLTFRSWRGIWFVPPKRWTCSKLHAVATQTTVLFTVTAVRTCNISATFLRPIFFKKYLYVCLSVCLSTYLPMALHLFVGP
jgi:hypothetical protein